MNRAWRRPWLAGICLAALATGAHADTSAALAEALTQGTLRCGEVPLAPPRLAAYYATPPQPLWLAPQGVNPRANALQHALVRVAEDGLDPAQALLTAIRAQGAGDTPGARICLELLHTAAFDRHSLALRHGQVSPARADPTWLLRPDPFDTAAALRAVDSDAAFIELLESLAPAHLPYQRLRAALARYRQIAAQGGWASLPAGPALAPGMRHAQVPGLRKRLRAEGDLRRLSVSFGATYDEALVSAVRRFQKRHGLAPDGVVGARTRDALNVPVAARIAQLRRTLERLRWLPRAFGARHVLVNTAGFQLEVIEDGKPVLTMRTINGTPDQATPSFSGTLQTLVINPYWYVPRRIALERLWPRERAQPGSLAARGFRVFDTREGDWRELDTEAVASLTGEEAWVRVRQDPGPRNLMGRLSFVFPNPHDIFLHDTPDRALFGQDIRTFSEGCVRIENAMALALYLLRRAPDWTAARIQTEIDALHHQNLALPEPLPVYVLYLPAWVADDGQVHFREDVYQRERVLTTVFPPK